MPGDGRKNLIPTNQRTEEEAKAISRKGGIKSGQVRREKRDLRKALQLALNNTYTTADGEISAIDAMARNLVAKAVSKNNKDAMQAIKYICELTGMNKTPEQIKKEKVEIDLMEQELKLKQQLTQNMEEGTDNEFRVEIVRASKTSEKDGEE